jgi:hypothetical protein
VLTFVVVLTIATAAVSAGMWLLFRYFDAQEAKEPQRGPMALTKKEDRLPPEPRLQAAPGFELKLEDGQKSQSGKAAPQSEYDGSSSAMGRESQTGLKDQSGNVVGMPINRRLTKLFPVKDCQQGLKGRAESCRTMRSACRPRPVPAGK